MDIFKPLDLQKDAQNSVNTENIEKVRCLDNRLRSCRIYGRNLCFKS